MKTVRIYLALTLLGLSAACTAGEPASPSTPSRPALTQGWMGSGTDTPPDTTKKAPADTTQG